MCQGAVKYMLCSQRQQQLHQMINILYTLTLKCRVWLEDPGIVVSQPYFITF